MRMTLIAIAILVACSSGPPQPALLDTRGAETCRWCRMVISDRRYAAQIVANGYDPLFFDDIGCMANYLKKGVNVPPKAVAYVADYRQEAWVRAADADYFKCASFATPMNSGLIATRPGGTPTFCAPVAKESVLGAAR